MPISLLTVYRLMMGMASAGIFAFWLVYRAIDASYHDPFWVRAVVGSLPLVLLGWTFVGRGARARVRIMGGVVAVTTTAYVSWLAAVNGIDGAWALGVCSTAAICGLALALYAESYGEIVGWLAAVGLAEIAPLTLAEAPEVPVGLFVGYMVIVSLLEFLAGVARVAAFRAIRGSREHAEARGRLLRTVIDTIPMHVYVKDREGRCLIRNAYSAETMGFDDPKEAVGLTAFDTSEDPEIAAAYWEEEDRVMTTNEPVLNHEERYAYGGEQGWIVTSRIPIHDPSGEVIGIVGVTRDVTEQKAAEAALRESEARTRTVIDAALDAVLTMDQDGCIVGFNPAAEAIFGIAAEDAIGQAMHDLVVPEEHREAHRRGLAHFLKTGEGPVLGKRLELSALRADGAEFPAEFSIHPIRLASGGYAFTAYLRDVTERKAAEAALVASKDQAETALREADEQRQLLRTVIDTIPDHIYVKDTRGRATLRNRASAQALGYDCPEAAVGHDDTEATDTKCGHVALADDLRVIESGEPIRDKEEHDLTGGWLLTTKVPLRDVTGEITGLVGVSRDITTQREAKAALVAAKEAAEAATRAKSEFLANMSHEIRTPMNGVIGMTSLLLDTPLDREQRDFVETIRTSGDALLTIINDILDFSKIEAGMLSLEVQPFEVRTCVEEALDLVAQAAAEKGVELAYLVEDGVPRTVRGDVTRVRQVLVNLLSNAVKFTPEGSVCVRVHAIPPDAAAGRRAEVFFSVEDTGIGIAQDKLDLVFESFSQADASTTRQFGGTGLGLTISRRLVEMMGGTIGVESEVGVGSTFRFSVDVEVAPSTRRVFLRKEQPALEGRRTLVVDDNDVNREILTRLAQRWRMGVEAVASGPDALSAADRAWADGHPFDLVLLDMQMPGMDGLEVARRLRDGSGRTPIIVMLTSIHREGTLRRDAKEAGVHAVLYKPTKPSQLYDVLIEAFEGATEEPVAWVARARATDPPEVSPVRILLAEDNAVNQKVAVRLLGRLGHAADVVANGAEAVEAVRLASASGRPYEVVFMDVQMPEVDGLEATRRIRSSAEIASQPYVVALTANAMEGDREACLDAGADNYLSKPVNLEVISVALEQAIQHRAIERQMA